MTLTFEYKVPRIGMQRFQGVQKIYNCCVLQVHTLLPDIVWIPAAFVACEEVDVSLVTFFLVTPASIH